MVDAKKIKLLKRGWIKEFQGGKDIEKAIEDGLKKSFYSTTVLKLEIKFGKHLKNRI